MAVVASHSDETDNLIPVPSFLTRIEITYNFEIPSDTNKRHKLVKKTIVLFIVAGAFVSLRIVKVFGRGPIKSLESINNMPVKFFSHY